MRKDKINDNGKIHLLSEDNFISSVYSRTNKMIYKRVNRKLTSDEMVNLVDCGNKEAFLYFYHNNQYDKENINYEKIVIACLDRKDTIEIFKYLHLNYVIFYIYKLN